MLFDSFTAVQLVVSISAAVDAVKVEMTVF